MSERISAKLGGFQPSLTLALKDMAQERRRQGLPIYYFGLGETKGDAAPWVSYQPMVKAASATPVVVRPESEGGRLKVTGEDLRRSLE